MKQIFESQETPHTSPSRASYGVSLARLLEKIDRVITAPHCISIERCKIDIRWIKKKNDRLLLIFLRTNVLLVQSSRSDLCRRVIPHRCKSLLRFELQIQWYLLTMSWRMLFTSHYLRAVLQLTAAVMVGINNKVYLIWRDKEITLNYFEIEMHQCKLFRNILPGYFADAIAIVYYLNGPLARYVILRVAYEPGMPWTFSPPRRFSIPGMHHGTCVMHVPWCMPISLISGFMWSRCNIKYIR